MSEYRRFISYIYDYRNGKKRNACGFVKAEIRNEICRIDLRLEPKSRMPMEVQVYGFVRTGGKLLGIPVGKAVQKRNAWELQASTYTEHFAMSDYKIGDIRGIWLRTEQKENYITVWDDETVDPALFVTELLPEEPHSVPEAEASAQDVELPEQDDGSDQRTKPSLQAEKLSGSLAARWGNFLNHYPQITPFDDDEIYQCICISPKDLSFLPKEERQFAVNPFLREGYDSYGYLLLGCHRQGRFVLAVPGKSGEMQERHLARMCGFPMFKEGRQSMQTVSGENKERNSFGYWYHFLNEECPGAES